MRFRLTFTHGPFELSPGDLVCVGGQTLRIGSTIAVDDRTLEIDAFPTLSYVAALADLLNTAPLTPEQQAESSALLVQTPFSVAAYTKR